jgi:hydrogenase maturation factor
MSAIKDSPITYGIDNGQVVVTVSRDAAKQAPIRLRLAPAEARELGRLLVSYAEAATSLTSAVGSEAPVTNGQVGPSGWALAPGASS